MEDGGTQAICHQRLLESVDTRDGLIGKIQ